MDEFPKQGSQAGLTGVWVALRAAGTSSPELRSQRSASAPRRPGPGHPSVRFCFLAIVGSLAQISWTGSTVSWENRSQQVPEQPRLGKALVQRCFINSIPLSLWWASWAQGPAPPGTRGTCSGLRAAAAEPGASPLGAGYSPAVPARLAVCQRSPPGPQPAGRPPRTVPGAAAPGQPGWMDGWIRPLFAPRTWPRRRRLLGVGPRGWAAGLHREWCPGRCTGNNAQVPPRERGGP